MDRDDALERIRDLQRERIGRVSFDCFNLKERGDRCYCAKGHLVFGERHPSLLSILKGRTALICKTCKDFDGDENNNESNKGNNR